MKLSQVLAVFSENLSILEREIEINTDTRTLQPNQVFLALVGENFDGHHFLKVAQEKGAVLAIVSEKADIDLPQICVPNTLQAYGQLALAHRLSQAAKVVGITGSCGKTTTKNYLARICSHAAPTLYTHANLNNEVGVPQTLLKLTSEYQFAVVEMGANSLGEIKRLSMMARPDVAVITLVAAQHVEGFGSVDNIAREKGCIYQGLTENGVAVMPCDDPYYSLWSSQNKGKNILSFGFSERADVQIKVKALTHTLTTGILRTPNGTFEIETQLLGRHSLYNAAAAAAAACALAIPIECIQAGIAATKPEDKRMCILKGYQDATLINDCYNASPLSVLAALDILATYQGRKILVFGDMKELGEEADRAHRSIGEKAKALNIDAIFAVGEKSKLTLSAFAGESEFFENKQALIEALKPELGPDVTVLIKGARFHELETVVDGLR